jgi:hypothetical protein
VEKTFLDSYTHRRPPLHRYGDALNLRVYALVSLGFERLVWEELSEK